MKQYVVDAFADSVFSGNPAAVCINEQWLADEWMQNIAKENNLSETAFVVKKGQTYDLRWFTPGGEIDFCGHATLGSAFVLKHFYEPDCQHILFNTVHGKINVAISGDIYEMDFPAYSLNQVPVTEDIIRAIGVQPTAAYLDRDLLLVLENETDIHNVTVNQELLKKLDGLCVAVTAKSSIYDCISRVFAPKLHVPEDPVTGSTHCMIVPYWAKILKKNTIVAYQASERTGVLYAKLENNRVKIAGKAVLFSIAEILPGYSF